MRAWRRALCASWFVFCAQEAGAEIVKCKDSSGQVTYTQGACPPGTSPLELPEFLDPDTGSSFTPGSGPARPLSPRAAALKAKFDKCDWGSSPECKEFMELGKFCTDRSNWGSGDCEAVREVNADFVDRLDRMGDRFRATDKKKCREDHDENACQSSICPMDLMMDGTNAEVRACSRFRNLPSNAAWAQISERNSDQGWTGEYLCLRMVEFVNPIGQRVQMRPPVTVRDAASSGEGAGGYRTSGIRKETFPTREAAVLAGCEAVAGKLRGIANGSD